jgi:hypothetical protein
MGGQGETPCNEKISRRSELPFSVPRLKKKERMETGLLPKETETEKLRDTNLLQMDQDCKCMYPGHELPHEFSLVHRP